MYLLAQDTTPTPSRYTKTIYIFICFHQDYNAKMRLEKKNAFQQFTKTRDEGGEHTTERDSKFVS